MDIQRRIKREGRRFSINREESTIGK